jgi:hypothetical protein
MAAERDPFAFLEFGRFRIVRHRRELLADERPLRWVVAPSTR